jgi:hypothetical protein
MTRTRRETLLLIGVGLALVVELTWVVHHVKAEVIDSQQSNVTANPTAFTDHVIQAANPEMSHLQH